MYLYVWDDVFCDHTCGIAFAIAHNVEEAIEVATDEDYMASDLAQIKPHVYQLNRPIGRAIYGGG